MGITLFASRMARAGTLEPGDQNYTTLAAWEAAVTQTGEDTFTGVAPSAGETSYNTSAGYTDPLGIDFVGSFGSTYSLDIVDSLFAPTPYWNFGSGASLASGEPFGTEQPQIVANLPGGVTAIALDVMTYGNIVPVTITASDGTTFTVSTTALTQTFYGFTFNAPVSTLTISVASENGGYVLLDNFCIGTGGSDPSDTPEPVTLVLVGLGLVLMGCLKKRRHRLIT